MKSQITVLMIILLVLMHHASVSVSEGKSLKQGRIQEKWRVGLEGSLHMTNPFFQWKCPCVKKPLF